ncbi:MAG: FAD-dependent oxidoreductase [Halanaerobiales bacterium]
MLSTELLEKMDQVIDECMGDAPPYCKATCPLHIDAKGYVNLIQEGKYQEALDLIREYTPFAGILGRVCAHPCEEQCKRQEKDDALSVKNLKRFAADNGDKGDWLPEMKAKSGKKVAVVGAGPAGAQAAFELRKEGHDVVIFEALPVVGGMLRVGIPEYRLPEKVIEYEYSILEKMGVEIKLNTRIGEDFSFDQIKGDFDAVFMAIGAHKSIMIPLEGKELEGIIPGADFLREVSLTGEYKLGKKVAVIGGGNVAMDVARSAWRVGAEEIELYCLESREEMPAHSWEIKDAEEEGIKVNCGWGPLRYTGDGNRVNGLVLKKCIQVFDEEGNFNPQYDEETTRNLEVDNVIMAIGQSTDASFLEGIDSLELQRGKVVVDPLTLQTADERFLPVVMVQVDRYWLLRRWPMDIK